MSEENKIEGKCPNCGREYKSQNDLVECKYSGIIWWICPTCHTEV